jgi:hypothetical protein
MVENYGGYLKFHYADGHHEIVLEHIRSFMLKHQEGYKRPIQIGATFLHPTFNIHDERCRWVNLEMLEENNIYYNELIQKHQLVSKMRNMYTKYKGERVNIG